MGGGDLSKCAIHGTHEESHAPLRNTLEGLAWIMCTQLVNLLTGAGRGGSFCTVACGSQIFNSPTEEGFHWPHTLLIPRTI